MTVTPYADAARRALDKFRAFNAEQPGETPFVRYQRLTTSRLIEALLPMIGEMRDMEMDFSELNSVISISVTNMLVTHCSTLSSEDQKIAHALFHQLIKVIEETGCNNYRENTRGTFAVTEIVQKPAHGHA